MKIKFHKYVQTVELNETTTKTMFKLGYVKKKKENETGKHVACSQHVPTYIPRYITTDTILTVINK